MRFLEALESLERGERSPEAVARLLAADEREAGELFARADAAREKFVGKATCVHGVLEFSNWCRNNCLYCGIRRESRVRRYRMKAEDIIEHVVWAVKELGYKMVVLQSGEDPSYDIGTLCDIAHGIKKRCNVILFYSIGDRSESEYAELKRAGAAGVLYRFETTARALFEKMRPGTSFDRRIEHLKFMRRLRYLIATGFMIGLPGQSIGGLARDVLALGEFGANMVSVGPFVPSPPTPLAGERGGDVGLALRTIAVARLLYKRVRIPVTTAFETLDAGARRKALFAGANSLMINITPREYSADYAIYPNRFGAQEDIERLTGEALAFVERIGRRVCRGYAKDLMPKFAAPVCA
ncbi:MAG: radical SAM protein [Candidatus Micrarchaeia archaeon]